MNQKENISASSTNLEFDKLMAQRELREEGRRQKKRWFKFILFFSLLIYYTKLLFLDGFGELVFPSSGVRFNSGKGGVGGTIIAFVAAVIFIWLPTHSLESIEVHRRVPGLAFKFFGWVVYLLPAVIMLVYYAIKLL